MVAGRSVATTLTVVSPRLHQRGRLSVGDRQLDLRPRHHPVQADKRRMGPSQRCSQPTFSCRARYLHDLRGTLEPWPPLPAACAPGRTPQVSEQPETNHHHRRLRASRACRSLPKMRGRLTALLLVALVAVMWASPQSIEFLCSMTGQRGSTCCCGPHEKRAEAAGARVKRPSCCEVERTPASVSPALAATSDNGDDLAVAPGAGLRTDHSELCSAPELISTLPRGPPQAIGQPSYLRNCRFLI